MSRFTLGWLSASLLILLLVAGTIWLSLPPDPGPADGTDGPPAAAEPYVALPVLERIEVTRLNAAAENAVQPLQLEGRTWVAVDLAGGAAEEIPEGSLRELSERLGSPEAARPGGRAVLLIGLKEPASEEEETAEGAAAGGWHLLQAPAEVRELVRGAGEENSESSPAETAGAQPGAVALIDAAGRIRVRYASLSDAVLEQIISDIDRLQAGQVAVPEGLFETRDQLAARAERQQQTAEELSVFHGFRFTDGLPASGITFQHHIVADAGKDYEAAHYDHGNGLAVADVDGDGLLDLYFLTQAGSNELWRNLGGGKFENITEAAGVGLADRISVSAAFGDIDNDGDADLFVTTVRFGNVLFLNDGAGRFRDITDEAGVGYAGHSSGAVFFDYDRDGLLDLFVTNVGQYTRDETRHTTTEAVRGTPLEYSYYEAHSDAFAGHLQAEQRNERSILYHNLGEGQFEDVTEAMNLVDASWSGDAAPLDANGDGWTDLYVLNMQGHDEYYENVEGQRFERKSAERFPATPWGSMGVRVFDFNGDGRFDLFLTDMHSDMSAEVGPPLEKLKSTMNWPPRLVQSGQFNPQPGRTSIYGNALFRAEAETGRFTEVSDATGAENYWPWGLSTGDLNADGWEDVFITASMNYPFRYGVNSLLLNVEGQRFHDSEFLLGVEPRPDGKLTIPWFELDSSGADAEHRLSQERRLSGRRVVWSAAGSRSSVITDIDGDGDLDILTGEFNTRPQLLLSTLTEANPSLAWLKIRLRGTQSNRDGLGAVVRVHAGERVMSQVYDGCSGYLSHSLYPLYFGLGTAQSVDRVEVVWPSWQKQTVDGPHAAGNTLTITEPEAAAGPGTDR